MLDNHMVHGNKDKGCCPECGRLMNPVDWCDENHHKCEYCKGDDESTDCPNKIEKLYCSVCEISVPID